MSESNFVTRPVFKKGDVITAQKLNQLAREVYATIEVGPGLTKTLSGNRVVIGLSRTTVK